MSNQNWHGFRMEKSSWNGHETIIVFPDTPAEGTPWVWRAEFFDAFASVDLALVRQGWHIAYHSLSNLYGAPESIEGMKLFHGHVVKLFALNKKADLFGFSRGGLYAVNYAAAYPEDVASLYLDAPVLDIRMWPGGLGRAPRQDREWEECKTVYHLSEDAAASFSDSPLNRAGYLAGQGIPVILVAGGSDEVVHYEENGQIFDRLYRQADGTIHTILKPGVGHHPHSLEDPTEIVSFIIKHGVIKNVIQEKLV